MNKDNPRMKGVVPSLIVPLRDDEIDPDGLAREVEFLNQAGVDGLAIGGGLGELVGRTPDEFLQVCRVVRAGSSLPLAVTLLPDSNPELEEMLQAIESIQPDVVFVAQPHYLFQTSTSDLYTLFRHIRSRLSSALGLANTLRSAMIHSTTVQMLMEKELIDLVLQGGIDPHGLVDVLALPKRKPVFCGVDDLAFTGLMLGAEGTLSTLATVFPEQILGLHRAFAEGDYARARTQHEALTRVWRYLDHSAEGHARIYAALASQGRAVGKPFSPFDCTRATLASEVRATVERQGFPVHS